MERIQKVLASAGIGSRRAVEGWIREGRIQVNGQAAELGQKIEARDRVTLDGRTLRLPHRDEATRVLLYKKRVGELVTRSDPQGRPVVFQRLPKLSGGRWIAVGRLDINTSGLLLLTNDGELARRLMHPSFQVTREYAVRVLGEVDAVLLKRLRQGVELDDGPARFERIVPGATTEEHANRWFQVTLREGRNRLVRRLFESQGLQVSRLMRVAYGPIRLVGGIRSGSAVELEAGDVAALCAAVDYAPRGAATDDRNCRDSATRNGSENAVGKAPADVQRKTNKTAVRRAASTDKRGARSVKPPRSRSPSKKSGR